MGIENSEIDILEGAILRGINRILHDAITSDTEERLGETCLIVAEELTQSKFGFIGEINREGRLDDIAISNPGWGSCRMANPIGHRMVPTGFKINGLYGRVILDGKPLFTNDPPSHPDSIGTPPGHPPLKSFCGVPLLDQGKVVGIIGMGNREGGYSQKEVSTLEALAPSIIEALSRKRAEEALKLDEMRLETLVELSNMKDATGEELFNFGLESALQVTGSRIGDINTVDPDERTAYIRAISKDVMAGCAVEGPKYFDIHKGGIWTEMFRTRRPLIINNYALPHPAKKGLPNGHLPMTRILEVPVIENGKIVALCLVGNKPSDYTEADVRQLALLMSGLWRIVARKRAEDEVREAKGMAELYLDLMGHDIRNMHQVAMGNIELVAESGNFNEDDERLLQTAMDMLKRSSILIDNVHKLQALKAGGVEYKVMDLCGEIRSVVEEYGQLASILTNADDCRCLVHANELLHDVISNIVGNAIKHASRRDIEIFIGVELADEDGKSYCKVCIDDNGHGIPDELKAKIFNRLQRGPAKIKGSGLGLYLVSSLVESFNGRVWVEDRVKGDHKQGARFVVMLPAVNQ